MKKENPGNTANLKQYQNRPSNELTRSQVAARLDKLDDKMDQLIAQVEALNPKMLQRDETSFWQRIFG